MLDTIRHLEVFSAETFGDLRVDVIGVGATGSRIALALAKLGIRIIHVWDFDIVESHNVPNQIFGLANVSDDTNKRYKVFELQKMVKDLTGTEIVAHNERVDGTQRLGDIVFLLTDSMTSRKEIWKKAIRYKPIKLMVETRMGHNSGRVYALNPSTPAHVRGWESASDYTDEEAPVSACGGQITVGSTAEVVSGLAVWQLIRWHQALEKMKLGEAPSDLFENEIVFSLQPIMIVGHHFGQHV